MKSPRGYVMTARARAAEETGTRILDAAAALFPHRPLRPAHARGRRGPRRAQTVVRRVGDKDGLVAAAQRESARVALRLDEGLGRADTRRALLERLAPHTTGRP